VAIRTQKIKKPIDPNRLLEKKFLVLIASISSQLINPS
jgi:hypothetical protein